MIHFLFVFNRQSKSRLSRWYSAASAAERAKAEGELMRLILARDSRHTNFIEYRQYKVVYRRYAGLFFAACVDVNDNELSILEFIHLFVELLDGYFGNVCELDLVFRFDRCYGILDEIILGGEVAEVNINALLPILKAQDRFE